MRMRFFGLIALVGLAACAQSPRWEHSTAPRERWPADTASCARFAAHEAEREYAREIRSSGQDFTGETPTHDSRMAVYEMRKYQTRVVERCMADKGYTKAK